MLMTLMPWLLVPTLILALMQLASFTLQGFVIANKVHLLTSDGQQLTTVTTAASRWRNPSAACVGTAVVGPKPFSRSR